MNEHLWSALFSFGPYLATCALAALGYWLRKSFVNVADYAEDTGRLARRMETLERQTNSMETMIRQMPVRDDIHRLELLVEKVCGRYDALGLQMDGVTETMGRIERQTNMLIQHHIEGERA